VAKEPRYTYKAVAGSMPTNEASTYRPVVTLDRLRT
jgi:hypothetical protein